MISSPSVTVIIPYKNNLKLLFQTLKSIFKQSYKNYFITIIYDKNDKLDFYQIKIFLKRKYHKKLSSIKIICNKKNLGAGLSRNVGIKKCKTKYVAFLDSDDLWSKDKLKSQIDFMEKNKLLFSHTSYNIINERNKIISYRAARAKIFYEELLKSCDIGLSTVMINTNFLKKNNYYFANIQTKEDFILWLKISADIGCLNGFNRKLTHYRKTSNSLSSNKITSIINGFRVYRNYMKFNILKSLYFLFILSKNSIRKNFFS